MSRCARSAVAVILLVLLGLGAGRAVAADEPATVLVGTEGTTSDTTPTFHFGANEPGTTFECRLEGPGQPAAWLPCISPWTATLADGSYRFSVRATDEAGNVDPSPPSLAFTIDSTTIDTAIDAGPVTTVKDPTPTFTFTADEPGATFECRIEGGSTPVPAFAPCSSPYTTPALAHGAHALLVRAVDADGRRDATPARRSFGVDLLAPETSIAAGPAEGGTAESRTPFFAYTSEPGATFECRMLDVRGGDADLVRWTACGTDGFRPAPLSSGEHTFEVRAIDAAGNADPSPAARRFSLRACDEVVRFGLLKATAATCFREVAASASRRRWETTDDVVLNGIRVPTPGSTKVVLEGPGAGDPDGGGTASVNDVALDIAGVRLPLPGGDLKLEIPGGKPGTERQVAAYRLDATDERLLGLELEGEAALRLRRGTGDDYRAVLALHVALPSLFRNGPDGTSGGVTGDVAVRSDERGPQLDGTKIDVHNAYLGSLAVKSICLSFVKAGGTAVEPCRAPRVGSAAAGTSFLECRSDSDADRWDGSAAITLPVPSGTEIGVWAGLRDNRLAYAGASADRLGTLLPLAPGLFLERVALAVCVEPPPFKVKGEAAIAFGPDFQGRRAVVIDGSMTYTDAFGGEHWSIEATGGLILFEQRMLNARLRYLASGSVDFGFRSELAFGPASMTGRVDGWVELSNLRRFNVDGELRVCVDGLACANAVGVISSIGAAGCITVTVASVRLPVWVGPAPWDFRWEDVPVSVSGGAGYTFASRRLDLMAGTCSIGRWQVAARAAQAGPADAFEVHAGQPAVALRIASSAGAAPKVAIVGPDGRRITSPDHDGGAFVDGSHLLSEDDEAGVTSVMIAAPAAGTWHVEALPGSPAIRSLDTAGTRPAPRLTAHVAGAGRRRVLYYGHVPQAGQRVTFVELGRRTRKVLGVARGSGCEQASDARSRRLLACGRIRFAPGLGGAGRRRIEAVVEQDGVPRQVMTVARYVAPVDPRPGRPRRLRIRRVRGSAVVSWRGARDADRLNVVVRVSDGRRLLFIRGAGRGSVRVGRVGGRDSVTARVRAMRLDLAQGRAATRRLDPKREGNRTRRP